MQTQPESKPKVVPIIVDPVARSMAKPDACAKPGVMGRSSVRVRAMAATKAPRVRMRRRKHDYRDVQYY